MDCYLLPKICFFIKFMLNRVLVNGHDVKQYALIANGVFRYKNTRKRFEWTYMSSEMDHEKRNFRQVTDKLLEFLHQIIISKEFEQMFRRAVQKFLWIFWSGMFETFMDDRRECLYIASFL